MALLSSTTHCVRCDDQLDRPRRIAYRKAVWEDPTARASAYNRIGFGNCIGLLRDPRPSLTNVLSTSLQLVHRFFQKYEPQSPSICAFLLLILPAVVSGVFGRGASSILWPLLRTYAIFHTSLISSVVLYRLSPFHPLAKYPGPILAKISKLWFVSVHKVVVRRSGLMLRTL